MLPQQKKSKDTPAYILAGLKHKKSVFLGILEGPVFHLYMFILRVCDWLTVLRMTFHNRTKNDGNGTYRPLVMRQHICCWLLEEAPSAATLRVRGYSCLVFPHLYSGQEQMPLVSWPWASQRSAITLVCIIESTPCLACSTTLLLRGLHGFYLTIPAISDMLVHKMLTSKGTVFMTSSVQ